jgi:hypothetical protein
MTKFRNPFEGQPDPEVFPEGPSDKSAFTEYKGHIARCIYENVVIKLLHCANIFELFHFYVYGLIV